MKNTKNQTFREKSAEIASLLNANYYFLESVFIIKEEKGFRLAVTLHGQLILLRHFDTLRGAKIAFCRSFSSRKWKKNLRNTWSTFYISDSGWIKRKVSPIYREEKKKGTDE